MRKVLSMLTLLLSTHQALTASCCGCGDPIVSFEIGGGYRQDRLRWEANFDGDLSPELESHQRWKNIQSNQVSGTLYWVTPSRVYIRGMADYGRIYHGWYRERAVLDDFTFYQARAKSNEGELYDFNGGIGYFFPFLASRISITPLVGYSYHAQHLRMKDLHVLINTIGDTGFIDDFHANYRTRWFGPWVGVDLYFQMTCNLAFYGTAEWHWFARFRAKGERNFSTIFLDHLQTHIQQRTRGSGGVIKAGLAYDFAYNWTINAVFNLQCWRVHHGSNEVFFDDDDEFVIDSRLESLHWWQIGVMGSLTHTF